MQAACLEEKIIHVLYLKVGQSMANLIQRDWLKGNRLQIFSLKLDMCDDAFPEDGFIKLNIDRRHVENEVAQIVKDRPLVIDLHTVHERRAMHHDDIGSGIDFFVRPFLEPIRRSQALRQLFVEYRLEWPVV